MEHKEHLGCSCSTHDTPHGTSSNEEHGGHTHDDGCGCGHEHASIDGDNKSEIIRLIVGIVIFVTGIILSNAIALPFAAELVIFLTAYIVLGYKVLLTAGKNILKGKIFDENFLMTIATIGAFILGDFVEGTAVMLFYLVGETLSDIAVARSRKSITELMNIRPDYANIEKDGEVIRVSPESVLTGDTIVIKPFEKVPLDAEVIKGISTLDTSALTGESLPRDIAPGGEVLSGSVNGEGILYARVTKAFGDSTAAKILDIVENAGNKKAQTEKFITKFARYYTPIVCAVALAVGVIPSIVTGDASTWIYRALLFLVISCPCALVVSVPLSYFGGIGGASRKGILVKGANYMEALTNVSKVVFDKTGTLTKGVFEVQEIAPQGGYTKDEVLEWAAIAEAGSSHPIAKSVLAAYGKKPDITKIEDYADVAGFGVRAAYEGHNILAGSARLMEKEHIEYAYAEEPGTVLYVAKDGNFIGHILIADTLKSDAKSAVAELEKMGIGTAMLTGDTKAIAENIAAEIGIKEVYSELLPQDKVGMIEKLSSGQGGVLFAGDGINDAPVLARADVGVAMGALGSDAAIEAADVVLMTDEPSKIPEAVKVAGKTKKIVLQNIIFALAVKSVFMVLGVMGLIDMWAAVFADVGVTVIAIINSLRTLKN